MILQTRNYYRLDVLFLGCKLPISAFEEII